VQPFTTRATKGWQPLLRKLLWHATHSDAWCSVSVSVSVGCLQKMKNATESLPS
jgi:hypothetical protein